MVTSTELRETRSPLDDSWDLPLEWESSYGRAGGSACPSYHGALAQSGERLLCTQEVTGAEPVSSTISLEEEHRSCEELEYVASPTSARIFHIFPFGVLMISEKQNGIGLMGILFIVFLILKLVGTITWSWWWVTAPLWGPVAVGLAVMALFLLIGLILAPFSS